MRSKKNTPPKKYKKKINKSLKIGGSPLDDELIKQAKSYYNPDEIYDIIENLVLEGANVNSIDDDGKTVLHIILPDKNIPQEDVISMIDLFVEVYDFDIDSLTHDYKQSILHYACELGNRNIIKELLDQGAKCNIDKYGETPLHKLCEEGLFGPYYSYIDDDFNEDMYEYTYDEIVKSLIKAGCDINAVIQGQSGGRVCLENPIQKNVSGLALALINNGADVNYKDKDNKTHLQNALFHISLHSRGTVPNEEIVLALIEKGADINFIDFDTKRTPALQCVEYIKGRNDQETFFAAYNILKIIITKDINIEATDNNGNTLLHNLYDAVSYKHLDMFFIFNELIKKGANINAINFEGDTPLSKFLKSFNQRLENNDKFLYVGMNVDISDLIELLIDNNADINTNVNGTTPLSIACLNHNVKLATKLLDKGADINVRDKFGNTFLHICIIGTKANFEKEFGEIEQDQLNELAILLIENGLDVNLINHKNESPIYLLLRYTKIHTGGNFIGT